MDVTVASPEGFDLDPQIIKWTEQNCNKHDASFETINHPTKGYEGAHVVYSRHWMSPEAYKDGEFLKQQEIDKALKFPEWICDTEKMALTNNGIFTHPMPIDRGSEVTDEIASGSRSCIYDVGENRLHVQKAIMALTMAGI
jgi:N-acetylornithine carbamoyltransferase